MSVKRMLFQSREQLEEREKKLMAPYALLSANSRGRLYSEPPHAFRTEFQRDRDRIVHSAAFRRLESKTQVVVNRMANNFRTRLTHTLEVAGITRTTARVLGVNEDLAEAIALAHDLGHPPFGHTGEHVLNELMSSAGGFEHNNQSLSIVEELETKYPHYNGLNLTQEVREGIALGHKKMIKGEQQPSLEAQIGDLADEIAYCCHDLDDALQNGFIVPSQLKQIELWEKLRAQHASLKLDPERESSFLVRCMLNYLVEDLCQFSMQNIVSFPNPEAVISAEKRLISFSDETRKHVQQLRTFLLKNFYYHPVVGEIKKKASDILQILFQFYLEHPELMDSFYRQRIQNEGLLRSLCDFMASMTDRNVLQYYSQHIGEDALLKELISLPASSK